MDYSDSNVSEAIAQFNKANEKPTQKIDVNVVSQPAPTLAAQTAYDLRVAQEVKAKLEDAGIRSRNDLQLGRADLGKIAALLDEAESGDIDPYAAEKIIRNDEWNRQAAQNPQVDAIAEPETSQGPVTQPPDALSALQAERDAAQAELKRMKEQYGRESSKWGDERKRVAERLARLEQGIGGPAAQSQAQQYHQPYAAPSYDPRILEGVDPNVPLTAGQTAALMQNLAQALGTQLTNRDAQLIDAAREMRSYDLTSNEEADLLDRHGWLATLDRTSQIKAMRDLVTPLRAASQPVVPQPPPVPQRTDMEALARARLRTATTLIEPSSPVSSRETAAISQGGEIAKKTARVQELLRTPGGSAEAEQLIRELAGRRR